MTRPKAHIKAKIDAIVRSSNGRLAKRSTNEAVIEKDWELLGLSVEWMQQVIETTRAQIQENSQQARAVNNVLPPKDKKKRDPGKLTSFGLTINNELPSSSANETIQLSHTKQEHLKIEEAIDDKLYLPFLGVTGSISLTTIGRYLHDWVRGCWQYRKNSKDIQFDGMNAETLSIQQWMGKTYGRPRVDLYAIEEADDVLGAKLSNGTQKLVLVTHDESTFYANDGKADIWRASGENIIRKESPGMSIKVNEFPTHH
ncbi:uncharacterized protein BYT42DRAFT_613980 [Radiomyces spectabilis]|uniref:uncharacterized protein n=1 Tax=Radiomyces spectabilis TaxID=64574 RepID=UPI002220A12C|nr:uncharacterized protein BYT42DRAFT_613980 [Radiomyces spectabilis]KAI8379700.1 hypothetical protein BYT42DRAFT_613980 [Radiomyces spectabilis]